MSNHVSYKIFCMQDRSKVVVMDADGTRSKGVARSLRKLGTKASMIANSFSILSDNKLLQK